MSRPLRIHWSSNAPWAPSGYGVQTRLFLHRLKALGHDVSMTAWYGLEGGVLNMDGIRIYSKGAHPYGQDVQSPNAQTEKAEIVITLIDAWVMEPDKYPAELRWCPWFPVDMDPIPPPVANKVRKAFRPICYAKYGIEKCAEAGIDAAYVPHGVDTQCFQPMDRKACRAELKWRPDMFVVGMIAANKGYPSRKAFPECFEAFAQFVKRHDDAVLYVHSTLGENGQFGGVNLPELATHLGIRERVLFADQWQLHLGIEPDKLARIYNSLDVLLSPSAGEGFGVPILEAQACGVPVITGDWTAMPEITFHGWKVARSDAKAMWTPMAAYQYWPRPEAVVECLEEAYKWGRPQSDVDAMVGKAREFDADLVTERYWRPVLDDIASRIDAANALQYQLNGAVVVPGLQLPEFHPQTTGGAAVASALDRAPMEEEPDAAGCLPQEVEQFPSEQAIEEARLVREALNAGGAV